MYTIAFHTCIYELSHLWKLGDIGVSFIMYTECSIPPTVVHLAFIGGVSFDKSTDCTLKVLRKTSRAEVSHTRGKVRC